MPKYSVLVKTVVNVRIDNIEAESQEAAIAVATGLDYGTRFDSGEVHRRFITPTTNYDTAPVLRYTEWAEEDAYFLVDEEGDEEFERSTWYAKDGVTALSVPGGGITERCSECNQEDSVAQVLVAELVTELAAQEIARRKRDARLIDIPPGVDEVEAVAAQIARVKADWAPTIHRALVAPENRRK